MPLQRGPTFRVDAQKQLIQVRTMDLGRMQPASAVMRRDEIRSGANRRGGCAVDDALDDVTARKLTFHRHGFWATSGIVNVEIQQFAPLTCRITFQLG